MRKPIYDELTAEEREYLRLYRSLDDDGKALVDRMLQSRLIAHDAGLSDDDLVRVIVGPTRPQ